MLTPQQVMEAFAKNNLDLMMEAIRITASRQPQPMQILSPYMYAATIIHELGAKTREEFWATSLAADGQVIHTHRMYVGTAYNSVFRPAEIMRLMLQDDAIAFIVAHNHPGEMSSRIQPSPEDIQATHSLFKAANLIGIPLMDHVIVGRGQWYSMVEHDQLEEKDVRKAKVQRPPSLPRADNPGGQQGQARPGQVGGVCKS